MSPFKKRMFRGIITSAMLLVVGVILFKASVLGATPIFLIIFGAFGSGVFPLYYFFQYEEDEGGENVANETAAGFLNGMRVDHHDQK